MKAMRYILIVWVLALVGAQVYAVEYKPYHSSGRQVVGPAFTPAAAPTATFHSTSSMSLSGSAYSANPTIGSNGAAYIPSSSAAPGRFGGGRRKVVDVNGDGIDDETGLPIENIDNPDTPTPSDSGNVPLGDGLLVLMVCAGAYAAVRRAR